MRIGAVRSCARCRCTRPARSRRSSTRRERTPTARAAADPYDGRMSDRARTGTAAIAGALALDAALVVVFAVIGRSSHAEGLDVAGVWGTAWPFLVGPRGRLGGGAGVAASARAVAHRRGRVGGDPRRRHAPAVRERSGRAARVRHRRRADAGDPPRRMARRRCAHRPVVGHVARRRARREPDRVAVRRAARDRRPGRSCGARSSATSSGSRARSAACGARSGPGRSASSATCCSSPCSSGRSSTPRTP